MQRFVKTLTIAAVLTTGIGVGAASAQGNMAPEDMTIKYRKQVWQVAGNAMKSIGMIAKKEAGNPADIPALAAALASAAKAAPNAWKDKVEPFAEKTTALPKIWDEWKTFEGGLTALQTETDKLSALAAAGDMAAFGQQMGAVGKVCKDCHENFREKKK